MALLPRASVEHKNLISQAPKDMADLEFKMPLGHNQWCDGTKSARGCGHIHSNMLTQLPQGILLGGSRSFLNNCQ